MTVVTKLQTVQCQQCKIVQSTIVQRCTKTDVQSTVTVLQRYSRRVTMTKLLTKTVVRYVEL